MKEIILHEGKYHRVVEKQKDYMYCLPFNSKLTAIRRSKKTNYLYPKKECIPVQTCIIPVSQDLYMHLLNSYRKGEIYDFHHKLTKMYERLTDYDVVIFTCKHCISIACEVEAVKVLTWEKDIAKRRLHKVPKMRITTYSYALLP